MFVPVLHTTLAVKCIADKTCNCRYAAIDRSVYWPGYELQDQKPFPSRGNGFFLRHRFQIGSGAHPAFYQIGARGSLPGDNPARE